MSTETEKPMTVKKKLDAEVLLIIANTDKMLEKVKSLPTEILRLILRPSS